jgi:DNA-binding transcriptional regulator LsrR (DeoR family)
MGGKGMIKMANIELIRKLHFVERRSIRQISKDLGYSRQTIRKAYLEKCCDHYDVQKVPNSAERVRERFAIEKSFLLRFYVSLNVQEALEWQ